jgi:tRNA(Ile)-lysidine synthase
VLAHILRGSGLTGLGGIHPQVGKIVRPLLAVTRADLRTYLKTRKQSWREDATNRDTSKTRARIRKQLIPLLEKSFQPRVVEHLGTLARHAREDDALLDRVTKKYIEDKVEMGGGSARIKTGDLETKNYATALNNSAAWVDDAGKALSSRLVRLVIRKLKTERAARRGPEFSRAGEITSLHVEQILGMARSGRSGLSLSMPGGVRVRRVHDALIFDVSEKSRAAAKVRFEYKIDSLAGSPTVHVPERSCAFRFTVIDWLSKRGETSISGEVLNGDRLSFPLTLRDWRHGDRFHARGHSKPQKLKRLFGEEGIDRWRREGWPVLVSGGKLAWVRQLGPSAEFAVGAETRVGIVITEEQSE